MRLKIIFVDDEENVVHGLKRMLYSMRKEWEMSFVLSGEETLKLLEKEKYDVIVTDMRMPGMDGATLLKHVQEKYPQVIRIILSGHSNEEMALRSTQTAHQFLAKPCDSETLKITIEKTLKIRSLVEDEELVKIVNGIGELPVMPATYMKLKDELNHENISTQKVGQIIAQDITLSAKVLQLVNSAFFGLPSRITSPMQATSLLGINIIKSLVLYIETYGGVKIPKEAQFYLDTLWEYSFTIGNLSKNIMKELGGDKHQVDDAYIAGILHDIGKVVLFQVPDYYEKILTIMGEEELSFIEAEKKLFKTTHAEVGAYLLGLWGLPEQIVEAVAFHNRPSEAKPLTINPLLCLSIAKVFAGIFATATEKELSKIDFTETSLDFEVLNSLNITDKLNDLLMSSKVKI